MLKRKLRMLLILMAGCFMLGACQKKEQEKTADVRAGTPEEAAEYAMENLKALNLKAFNAGTDNYVGTERNFLGIPIRRKYLVFSELQQPGAKGKRYANSYRFSQKLMENLTWEIEAVREKNGQAEVDMKITNLDMAAVMGLYEIYILEHMIESKGTGVGQLIKDVFGATDSLAELMDVMDGESCTMEVTVRAYQEDGRWKLHISDEFINAFMGNINAEDYPMEMEQRIEELEKQYEKKMDQWGEELERTLQ